MVFVCLCVDAPLMVGSNYVDMVWIPSGKKNDEQFSKCGGFPSFQG